MDDTKETKEYIDEDGQNHFGEWFDGLDNQTAARINTELTKMRLGNLGDVKPVGQGVTEKRIHFGPGHRVYFGQDGKKLIVLLAAGSKKQQQDDIDAAQVLWKQYKSRKRKAQNAAAKKQKETPKKKAKSKKKKRRK